MERRTPSALDGVLADERMELRRPDLRTRLLGRRTLRSGPQGRRRWRWAVAGPHDTRRERETEEGAIEEDRVQRTLLNSVSESCETT